MICRKYLLLSRGSAGPATFVVKFAHLNPPQVIMATNRADTLDPALLRPGRLDRKIEFPLPDRRQKRLIFSTITSKMNLSEEVDLEDCILVVQLWCVCVCVHFLCCSCVNLCTVAACHFIAVSNSVIKN